MIPINVDCGEEIFHGYEHDLTIIKNCKLINLACGGHAGSRASLEALIPFAKEHHTAIGAHPSFVDKLNFGRVPIDKAEHLLVDDIIAQLHLILQVCEKHAVVLNHVKPHGALYNQAFVNKKESNAIVTAMLNCGLSHLKVMTQPRSMLAKVCEKHNIEVWYESFADRVYLSDGSLQSRKIDGSWIVNQEAIVNQYGDLSLGFVTCFDKSKLELKSDTVCVHGEHKEIEIILNKINAKGRQYT